MLDKEISKLIAYAENALFLDETDSALCAHRIARILRIGDILLDTEEFAEEVESVNSPNELLLPLLNYAAENNLGDADTVKSDIMDAISLRPSEINDLFADTYAVNKQRAFDFLYDYCVKNGYVDPEKCAKNDRWVAKELKSGIEVIINFMPQAKTGKYPSCALCRENEGLGKYARANMRTVSCDIDGEEWFFTYSRHQYFEKHGVVTCGTHRPLSDDIDTIKKLALCADFVGGEGFVGSNAAVRDGGAKNTSHEHFQIGFRSAPMLKAATARRFKSKEYPYIDIHSVDWYSTVIRVAHSNSEKIVEFVEKIVSAWKAKAADGSHFVNLICRKISGKYCFDIVLRSSANQKSGAASEYSEIKADALSLTDIAGYFVLPNTLSEQLKNVRMYLDGTLAYEPASLPADMKPFSKMIARMLKEQGGTVTKLEAKLNVHDEVDAACEKILHSTAVFDSAALDEFFAELGIYELN